MAETVSEVLEQIAVRRTDRKVITLDAREDFHYRAPKKIISFVLANLLQSLLRQTPNGTPTEVAVVLAPGIDGNGARITTSHDSANPEFSRAVRCALWAFGGELGHTSNRNSGTATTSVRLPKSQLKLADQIRSFVVGFRPRGYSIRWGREVRIERDIDRTVSFRNSQGAAVRGTLSKLSRRNIVFEVYNPFSPLQASEVLTDLKVRRGKNVVYQGDAVVTGVVTTSILVVVSATLVSKWTALNNIISESASIRSEVAHFIDEWERVNELDPNYQVKVADLRSFLSDLSFWLDQVDLAAEDEHGAPAMALDAEKFEELKAPVMPRLTRLFMELEEACRQLEVDEVENHKLLAQRDLLPLMMASPFFNRVYSKPLGYAGDYEMVNMMFRKERGGKSTYAQVVNDWLLNGGPPQAHRNRIYLLEKMLTKAAEDATFSNKNLRVLNVGCGPVQELQLFIAKNKSAHRFSFDLLDFNAETLNYAKQQIESITADRAEAPKVTYILKTVQELLRQAIEMPANFQSYDIIYCAGLFDYLSDRVCAKLTRLFYQWCEPGGRVIVTNVHSSNPVKGLMEHVMEWHLVMRDESDMVRLVPDLEPLKVYTDDTGINVFLEIEKPTS